MQVTQKVKTSVLFVVLALALITKLLIDGFVDIEKTTGKIIAFNTHKQFSRYMNVDDIEMASVARNVIIGKGFVTNISYDRPKFRDTTEWATAFRPKLNVLLHVACLRLYTKLNPDYNIADSPVIPAGYFEGFAKGIFIIKNIMFIIALFYFYRLAALYLNPNLALLSTILFCLYPSVILYVGMINILECIIMPALVIIISIHLYNRRYSRNFSPFEILFITLSLPVICFLKMQVCLIFLLFYMVAAIDVLIEPKRIKQYLIAYMPANLLIVAFICYNFTVNEALFGRLVFSTQSSVNIWHGHNEFARGSWNPAIWQQHYNEIEPVLEKNRSQLSGNEVDETNFYKKWAFDWIKSHPKQELMLCIKKVAIYFLPENSNCHRVNIFTLGVHLFFLCFLIAFFIYWRKNIEFYYLLAPAVAILLTNIIFFVEYRWRYLADPFMLLLAIIFVSEMVRRIQLKPEAQKMKPAL